jgi:hypothetical protein
MVRDAVYAAIKELPILRCSHVSRIADRQVETTVFAIPEAVHQTHKPAWKIRWKDCARAKRTVEFCFGSENVRLGQQHYSAFGWTPVRAMLFGAMNYGDWFHS